MNKPTFACSQVCDAIAPDKGLWQPHLSSAGVCETGTLIGEVADQTKDNAAFLRGYLSMLTDSVKKHLALGERVTIDGLCRFEIYPEGSLPAVDAPWDPTRNRLVVTTFGLIGETTPRVFRKPVTLVEAIPEPPPEITDIRYTDGETPDLMFAGSTNIATGTGLAAAAKVKLELLSEDGEELIKTYDLEVDEATDTSVSFETVAEDHGSEFPQDGKVRVTLYESDGTTPVATRKVRMHVPGR